MTLSKDVVQPVLNFLKKHWWKIVLIILAFGLAFSGYTCESGDKKFKKEGIYLRGKTA